MLAMIARCALACALALPVGGAWANNMGRPGSIDVSCASAGCHSVPGAYDYAVAVSIPEARLTSVEPVAIAVTFTVTNNAPGAPAAGFGWNIAARGARLAAGAGDDSQRAAGTAELVQETRKAADGDGGTVLRAVWTVPGISGDYVLRYCVLPVNGDRLNSGDGPARCEQTAVSVSGRPPTPGMHFIVPRGAASPTRLALLPDDGSISYDTIDDDMMPSHGMLTEPDECPAGRRDDGFYAPCYHAERSYVGQDEFVYRGVNAAGEESTGRVTIAVADPPAGPVAGATGWGLLAVVCLAGLLGRRRTPPA